MNKYNNPRLLNTVVSGTGMKNPVRPHVIIGSEENGFIRGDLMDANAIQEQIVTEIAAREHGDEELTEYIDEKVQQAVDDLVDGAPEVLDTLKELSEALGDDANFATTITEEIASKVDKVEGKGLSTNDYTTDEKQKLAGIAAGAEVNVQSDWNVTDSSNDAFIKNKPTKLSQFTNDANYVNIDQATNIAEHAAEHAVGSYHSEYADPRFNQLEDLVERYRYGGYIPEKDILWSDGVISPDQDYGLNNRVDPVAVCVAPATHFEDGMARFAMLGYPTRVDRVTFEESIRVLPNKISEGDDITSIGGGINADALNSPYSDPDGGLAKEYNIKGLINTDKTGLYNAEYMHFEAGDDRFNDLVPSEYHFNANLNNPNFSEWYVPSSGECLYLIKQYNDCRFVSFAYGLSQKYNIIDAEPFRDVSSFYITSTLVNDDASYSFHTPVRVSTILMALIYDTDEEPIDEDGYDWEIEQIIPFIAIKYPGNPIDEIKDYVDDELKENLTFTETTDPANGHEYVEIGGIKWATMNVGATSETDYGLYFQWGDTQGYTADQVGTGEGQKAFNWADYKYSDNGSSSVMTKYNATDGKTVLDLEDDAARANMGGQWRMPTAEELEALNDSVDSVWTENYNGSGINGLLCTDKTDSTKTLFFPAAGAASYTVMEFINEQTYVWNSSLYSDNVNSAYQLISFVKGTYYNEHMGRYTGLSVRGVLDENAQGETITTPIKEVVTDLKSNEEVIAAALNNLNTKIEATNLRIETFENVTFEDFKGSINEDVDYFTKFTPNTVGVDDAAGVFDYNVNQLQELVTNNNTEMLLTTTRNNKKLIVGTIRFFTDNFAHQVTAIATSNIHLDEWDKESSLSGVSHTDGKAYTYVCFCGLNDPAAYSGLQEGVWTDWKKLYPTMDDLDEAVNTLKNRQYMDSSTFDAIFTEADSDAIDYVIDNFAPTFYVKGSSNSVVTCSVVRSATAVCVFRNKIDEQTYNAIQECRRGTIGVDGTITWGSWMNISLIVSQQQVSD